MLSNTLRNDLSASIFGACLAPGHYQVYSVIEATKPLLADRK